MGSGKSTVCKIFEILGIPVYYADDRAKWLMANEQALKKKIIILFGEKAYLKDIQKLIAQRIPVIEDHPFLNMGEDELPTPKPKQKPQQRKLQQRKRN